MTSNLSLTIRQLEEPEVATQSIVGTDLDRTAFGRTCDGRPENLLVAVSSLRTLIPELTIRPTYQRDTSAEVGAQ